MRRNKYVSLFIPFFAGRIYSINFTFASGRQMTLQYQMILINVLQIEKNIQTEIPKLLAF